MSFDSVPTRSEVMGWNAAHLADFIKRRDLTGCDKVIMKCNMNGSRFLKMTENDLQKFPKIHAPLISKICQEINKKEEKRRIFPKKSTTPKYQQQVLAVDASIDDQGWSSEEFDDSDDDYERPNTEDEDGSGEDYELPTEGPEDLEGKESSGGESDSLDYEPNPRAPPEDIPHQICAAKPIADSDYIDNHRPRCVPTMSQPPVPPQRPGATPPVPTQSRPSGGTPLQFGLPPSRRDQCPQIPLRPLGKQSSSPPPVNRKTKPSTLERPFNENPMQVRKSNTISERPVAISRRPPVGDKPPEAQRPARPTVPLPSVTRSVSAVSRFTMNKQAPDFRKETNDDAPVSRPKVPFTSNTFPLQVKNPPPRAAPPFHSDSFPHNIPPGTGSLPSRFQDAMGTHRQSARTPADRHLTCHPPSTGGYTENEQDMDSKWYVGQVTRIEAESRLRRVNQDGTYLVRDSSKGFFGQPYTLMVLYQDKVYNLQIRNNNGVFQLGTGLKATENFSSVRHILTHYMQTPLLLIDAKNRASGQQKQCSLTHPAG